MTAASLPFVVHGWTLYAHPMFLRQLIELVAQVQKLRDKSPTTYKEKAATKRLAAITRLMTEVVPQEPSRPEYRQGKTLGASYKHWLRAKFFQQYRLFFRYHAADKIIVFAWVNDENNKRAYESSTDVYGVFERMLSKGRPPNDWQALIAESRPLLPTDVDRAI